MVNKLFAGNPTGTKNSTQNVWQISRVQGICLWEGTSNDSLFHTALSQAPSACRTISPERSLSGREGLLNGSECLGYALRRGSLPDHWRPLHKPLGAQTGLPDEAATQAAHQYLTSQPPLGISPDGLSPG